MAVSEPRVRAWWGKTTLARVRSQAQGEALLATVGDELLELVEQSTRLGWIPLTKHAALCDRLLGQLGPERFVQIMSEPDPDPAVTANMQARLGAMGDDPLVLLKHTASMWSDITADCGSLTVVQDDAQSARLELEGLPAIAMGAWLKLSLEALVQRALRATGKTGRIEVSASTASRMMSLRVSW